MPFSVLVDLAMLPGSPAQARSSDIQPTVVQQRLSPGNPLAFPSDGQTQLMPLLFNPRSEEEHLPADGYHSINFACLICRFYINKEPCPGCVVIPGHRCNTTQLPRGTSSQEEVDERSWLSSWLAQQRDVLEGKSVSADVKIGDIWSFFTK